MRKKVTALSLAGAICLSMFGATASAASSGTIDVVSTSHLDTVWSWSLEQTIGSYLPATFTENYTLIDNYSDYQFNFEGAYRYQLLKEYYPEIYAELGDYIDSGNWNVAGSGLENGDTNIPSPEALFRNFLYGNNYWNDEFGVMSRDIYLPDCFGFGYALPSIAAHSNLVGFSTQKLSWGNSFPNGNLPFNIGKWIGVDGSEIIANINYNAYTNSYNSGVRGNDDLLNKLNNTGIGVIAGLFGYGGDRGGGAYEATVRAVSKEIATNSSNLLKVQFASTDDLFLNLTDAQKNKLASYDGEMLMKKHGAGCYTSRALSKRWNRRAELIGDAAERANVASDWLGATEYPTDEFEAMWTNVISHQFHDDITGTSNSNIYKRSYNDYMVDIKQFAAEYESGVSGVAASMNTNVKKADAVPVVVNNPIAAERSDVVECSVTLDSTLPYVRVFDDEGNEVPAQVTSKVANKYEIAFVATVGSMGYRTYEVMPSNVSCQTESSLSIAKKRMEYVLNNEKYTVTIDGNGDISSIIDKTIDNTELLSEPIRLALFDESYIYWAAWELNFEDYATQSGDDYVDAPKMTVVENGPARIAVQITRTNGDSEYTQVVSLSADGEIVKVDNTVDWEEKGKLLKAEFNVSCANPNASYDLGLGAIERGNNSNDKAEVAVQKWADITATDNSYGVSVFNDCKYGMDKLDDDTIRLTLLHTPQNDYSHDSDTYGYTGEYGAAGQNVLDNGTNEFAFAVYGHSGSWTGADTQIEAEAFNQPMNAFQTVSHDGILGSDYSFGSISNDRVLVRALKRAEYSDEIVVRFNEGSGTAQSNVEFSLGNGIVSAREIYADEEPIGDATVKDGKLTFDIGKYEVKTFALTLSDKSAGAAEKVKSESVTLPYNIDAYSSNANKSDGGMNKVGDCYPSELVKATQNIAGISYTLGNMADGEKNAVSCNGQTIALPSGYTTLKLLAASIDSDKDATFKVDDKSVVLNIGDYSENIASGDIRSLGLTRYVKDQTPAVVATHRHTDGEDNIAAITYMFSYTIDIAGAKTITLPKDSGIIIFAATAIDDSSTKLTAISSMYDEWNRTADMSSISAKFDGSDSCLSINNSTSNTKNCTGTVEISNDKAYSGTSSLKLSGTDSSTSESYVYRDISSTSYTVTPGTILTFKYYAANDLGKYAYLDLRFTYGNPLRDIKLALDQDGVQCHPNIGHGKVGEWVTVTIDLYKYCPNSVIEAIMFAYDNPGSTGDFCAYIDDLYIGVPDDYLQQLMSTCESLDSSIYSDASVAALNEKYAIAKQIMSSDTKLTSDVDTISDQLGEAVRGLVEKRSAYTDVYAYNFNAKRISSIKTDYTDGLPSNIGGVNDESWATYSGVEFGNRGASSITLNYSGWNTSEDAYAEIHLGDKYGELLAKVDIPQTSTMQGAADWSQYKLASAELSRVITGNQDITIVFRNENGGSVCNLKTFTFTAAGLKDSLTELYNQAGQLDTDGATTEKINNLEAAKTAAKTVIDNADATENDVDKAYSDLKSAMDNLFNSDIVKGDVDNDGKVTVSDVVAMRKLIMSGKWNDSELAAGDMDGNGTLTVSDVVELRSYIMSGAADK